MSNESQYTTPSAQIDAYLIANAHKVRLFHTPKQTIKPQRVVKSTGFHTYIIHNPSTGLTKIGRSTHHIVRIRSIECILKTKLTIIHVQPGDYEKELHYRFHDHHVKGEWFMLTPQQIDEAKEILSKRK